MMDDPPWTAAAGGIALTVRLTPKGGRDAIDGIERLADGRTVLKARVRAVASEGAANAALVRLIADAVGVPPRAVAVTAGASSRVKRLTVSGDARALATVLDRLCATTMATG